MIIIQPENFRVHENAVSNPRSMHYFANFIYTRTTIVPKNVFEIGANYAQDAEGARYYFGLSDEDVWVFEAHPQFCYEIRKMYNFRCFNYAVFNKNQKMSFNAVDITKVPSKDFVGMSSLYDKDSFDAYALKIDVDAIRMDDFMNAYNIDTIDFLKLDVEGTNYEVLEGFGDRLKDVKCLHVEAEHIPIWKSQKLYPDIERLLLENNFVLANFVRIFSQSDSFWVQKDYLKLAP